MNPLTNIDILTGKVKPTGKTKVHLVGKKKALRAKKG